jgi:HD-GYP domain-containing protein (c-di-GMP phosphodiesterase class II)
MNYKFSLDHVLSEVTTKEKVLDSLINAHEGTFLSSINTSIISLCIAKEYAKINSLSKYESEKLCLLSAHCGLFHDVGKLAFDPEFLDYGKFSKEMFEEIKRHTLGGAQILINIEAPKEIVLASYNHHEDFNGNGYPNNISGDNIPLLARIIRVADSAIAAMDSTRTYKQPIMPIHLFDDINQFINTRYDPKIVEAFESVYNKTMEACFSITSNPTEDLFVQKMITEYDIKRYFLKDDTLSYIYFHFITHK